MIRFAKMSEAVKKISPILLYLVLCILCFANYFNSLPQGVHAWGQADRYAIAERFTDEVTDITHIRTFNIASEDGRTGAELPLVQYAAAKFSKHFAPDYLPLLIRLANFLAFTLGLFLLIWSFEIKDWRLNILVPILLVSSPIVAFYSYNFLPDIFGLGIILAMYAFLLRYIKTAQLKWVILCLVLGMLGSFVKLSVVIFLTANFIYFAIQFIRKKHWKTVGVIASLALISALSINFYVSTYMVEVNKEYWSVVFRAHSNPIGSINDFFDVIKGMVYWRTEYLSIPGYIVFALALLGIVQAWKAQGKLWRWDGLRFHSIMVLGGLALFMLVLGRQFINHDYYLIATFIPLIFVNIVWWFKFSVPQFKLNPKIVLLLLVGLTVMAFASTPRKVENRMAHTFKMRKHSIENYTDWLQSSEQALQQSQMPDSAILFALYHASPNLPLVYFNKKGMCFNHEEMGRDNEHLEYWLNKINPDYFLLPRKWNPKFKEQKAHLLSNLTPIYENNDLVLWRCEQNWADYLNATK